MSKKQMEKELNYGYCNNIFCFFSNLFEGNSEITQNDIDKESKKV